MKSILITGGAGYVGSVLTEQLLQEGYAVTVYDRFFFGRTLVDPIPACGRLTLIRGDIREINAEAFENVDAVIHLAALSNDPTCDLDPVLTEEINLNGTMTAARLAKEAGVRHFILSSSCSVYGEGTGPTIFTEESSPRPVSLYARMKLEAERQLLEMADETFMTTILRNATVYGISRRMRFDLVVNVMVLHAYKNHKIYVTGGGQQWRPLIHVRDLARVFLEILEAPKPKIVNEIFNVGSNDQNYQVSQLAQMVCERVPYTNIEWVPDDPDKRNYRVDFSKIQGILGFAPTHQVSDGIQEIYDGLRRGMLEENIRTKTVGFYRYLIDAERLVSELSLSGRML